MLTTQAGPADAAAAAAGLHPPGPRRRPHGAPPLACAKRRRCQSASPVTRFSALEVTRFPLHQVNHRIRVTVIEIEALADAAYSSDLTQRPCGGSDVVAGTCGLCLVVKLTRELILKEYLAALLIAKRVWCVLYV